MGQFAGEKVAEAAIVLRYVGTQLAQPIVAAVRIGSLKSQNAEGIDVANLIDVYGTVNSFAYSGVAADDVGNLQAGYIKRLRGRTTRHGAVRKFVGERAERRVAVVAKRQFAMNLVRNHPYAMLLAEHSHTLQLVTAPHSSTWIVRIAEQQQTGTLVREALFEVVKVDFVTQERFIIDEWTT